MPLAPTECCNWHSGKCYGYSWGVDSADNFRQFRFQAENSPCDEDHCEFAKKCVRDTSGCQNQSRHRRKSPA